MTLDHNGAYLTVKIEIEGPPVEMMLDAGVDLILILRKMDSKYNRFVRKDGIFCNLYYKIFVFLLYSFILNCIFYITKTIRFAFITFS